MIFLTEFLAIDRSDMEIKLFRPDELRIEAPSYEMAKEICRERYPYLRVVGEWEADVSLKTQNTVDNGEIKLN